jgi:hypothetical protein
MKPIKDCEHAQEDGCCGYPGAPTPECHTSACPRLAAFLEDAVDVCAGVAQLAEQSMGFRLALTNLPHDIGTDLVERVHAVLDGVSGVK